MGKFAQWLTSVWTVILIISILLFMFWGGPALSANTLGHGGRLIASYGFIPIAVAAVLLWRRKWEWAGFAYYTLGIALIKMVITMGIFIGASPRRAVGNAKPIDTIVGASHQESNYKTVVSNNWGFLRGRVDSDSPMNNFVTVITNIASGKPLERRLHRISVANQTVSPQFLVCGIGDSLEVTNHDRQLHTFNVTGEGGAFLQVPLAPDKTSPPQLLSRKGWFSSHCAQGHGDESLRLLVLAHPYHAAVQQNGSFAIDSIPPGHYSVEVYDMATGSSFTKTATMANLDIIAGDTTLVDFEITRDEDDDPSR
jgi:hypothetical protein